MRVERKMESQKNVSFVYIPSVPSPLKKVLDFFFRNLSANPHIAGTPQDFEQADMLRQFWLDAGLDHAATTPYDILLSYPSDSEPNILSLIDTAGNEVMASPEREANLTSEDSRDDFPFPYLGYSGNGTVHVSMHLYYS